MADIPFTVPMLYSRRITNRPEMVGGEYGLADSSNTFNRHVFVVHTDGVIAAVASGGASSCGLCLDASVASAVVDPPYHPFGDRHFPIALEGQRFAVSVTDASGHYTADLGAPQLSEVVVGTSYNILKLSNGNHALNVDSSSAPFFTVVEKPAVWNGVAQASTAYNPVVIVEIVSTVIQKI